MDFQFDGLCHWEIGRFIEFWMVGVFKDCCWKNEYFVWDEWCLKIDTSRIVWTYMTRGLDNKIEV